MHQPDSQEAPPKNQNRERNSDGGTQTALELTEELCEELSEELHSTTPVVCPSYIPGLVPHQKTAAPEATRKRHANLLPPPLLASDFEGRKEEEWRAWRGLLGWVCGLGIVGEWRARRFGGGVLVVLFGGVVGGGDLVVASCLIQNNDSKRKTAI